MRPVNLIIGVVLFLIAAGAGFGVVLFQGAMAAALLGAAVVVVVAVAAAVSQVLGRDTEPDRIDRDALRAAINEVMQVLETRERVTHRGEILTELDRATTALDRGDAATAADAIERIEELLAADDHRLTR